MDRSEGSTEASADVIAGAAAEWLALIDGGLVSARQQEAFKAWLAADPAHARAYERVRARWESPELRAALADFALSEPALGRRAYRRGAWMTVTALALAAGLALILLTPGPFTLSCLKADYCSETGQVREVVLTDGSLITLDTASAISVRFDGRQRQVNLLNGRALFAVKPDAGRPFRVDSRFCRTEVTGTRFVVAATEVEDTVTIHSGTVQVAPFGGKSYPLKPGDRAVVGGPVPVRVDHPDELETPDWLSGRLIVDDLTLAEVVQRIGRYRRGVIVFGNERLKSLRVSGQFDIRDTDHALKALEQTLPLKVRRITPWFVVLS